MKEFYHLIQLGVLITGVCLCVCVCLYMCMVYMREWVFWFVCLFVGVLIFTERDEQRLIEIYERIE